MSELIPHTAVYEDCARLALVSPRICASFKLVLDRYWDPGGLGGLTRSGDKYPVELLDYCRSHWANRQPGDLVEEKLAFVLGWRCHNAADRHFKPLYRKAQPEYYRQETDADADELLQDSVAGHPASRALAPVPVESALGEMMQRSLLGSSHLQSWIPSPRTLQA